MESKGLWEGTFCITTYFLISVCKGSVIFCVALKQTNSLMRVLFLLQKNKNHLQKLRLMSNDSVTNHCTSHFQGSCWAWIHASRLTKNLELLYQIQPSMAAGSQIPFGYLKILEMVWLSLYKGINLYLMNKADPSCCASQLISFTAVPKAWFFFHSTYLSQNLSRREENEIALSFPFPGRMLQGSY